MRNGTTAAQRGEEEVGGGYHLPTEHMIGNDPMAMANKEGTSGLDRVMLAMDDIVGRTISQNDQVAQLIADINSRLDGVARVDWDDPRREEAVRAINSATEIKPAQPQPVLTKAEIIDMTLQRWAGAVNHKTRIIAALQQMATRLNATI